MAEFKKLSDVEIIETPIDTANVLIEENGVIKRVPKDEVGGIKVDAAEVGQTIVVKAVDENGNPTEWEAVDKVKSWNDLEDKPFYEELEPLVSMTITEYYDSSSGEIYQAKTPIELDVAKDESYVVNVDGILYPCKGVHRNYMTSSHFYIGNGDLHLDFPGNGEPFVICHCWDDVDGWYYTTWFSDNNPHTITVYKPIVKPLDTKYLPKALQFGEEVKKSIVAEGMSDSYGYYYNHSWILAGGIVTGETYTFIIDNVEYTGIGYYDDSSGMSIDLSNTEGRTVAYVDSFNIQLLSEFFDLTVPHKIEYLDITIKQLDEKYLPDSIKGGGVEIVRGIITGEWDSGANKYVNIACDLTFDELHDATMRGALIFLYFQNQALYYQYEFNDSDADNHLLFTNKRLVFDLKYNDTCSIRDNN